jgi:hypothetical protein
MAMRALQMTFAMAQWLFAASVLVAAARFVWVAADADAETGAGAGSSKAAQGSESAAADPALDTEPASKPHRKKEARDNGAEPAVEMVRVMLSARHSQGRSPVYVNDALVGYTTFMADFSCQSGEPLTVRIVPARGPAIERTTTCTAPTLSISD